MEKSSDNLEIFPMMMAKVRKSMQRQIALILKPYGLAGWHGMFLTRLYENPEGLTRAELTAKNHVNKALSSRAMTELEAKGFLLPIAGERGEKLRLSKRGRDAAQDIDLHVKAMHARLFGVLTPTEQRQFAVLLQKICDAIEREISVGRPDGEITTEQRRSV